MDEAIPRKLLALSILQPWAWLIVAGHKTIENRTWRTGHRGALLIHAGTKWGAEQRDDLRRVQDRFPHIKFPAEFARGGLVGSVDLVDVVTESASPWFSGPVGFVLANSHQHPLIPLRGMLGIFPVDAAVLDDASVTTSVHRCHWPGCRMEVPPALWGCRRHWYMLPASIRNAISRTYRPGQEIGKNPSAEYIAAAKAAQDWITKGMPR